MSFGGQKSDSKSQASSFYDPTQTNLVNNFAQSVQQAGQPGGALAYKPYTGPGLNFGDPAQLQGLTGYQAPQVTAGQIGSTDLTRYLDPFTSDVINTTNADMARQGQIQQTNDAAQATASHAFGGSRSAVLQNLDSESMQRAMASTDAGLRQANFQQAQGAAGQDIASRLAADQGNQQASLASANARLQALGLNAQQAQAIFGANWQQYLNSQTDPQAVQALVNQAFSLVPSSPLTKSTSTASSFGFSATAPK